MLLSGAHGDGMADLANVLLDVAKQRGLDDGSDPTIEKEAETLQLEDRVIQVSLMGQPNVGKSTLLNSLVGSDRVICGPTAGLTRDSIPVEWTSGGRKFRLVDTAGLTRLRPIVTSSNQDNDKEGDRNDVDPSQSSSLVKQMSAESAMTSLRFSQVVVLVVEAMGLGKLSSIDLQLCQRCLREGRGLVLAANKSDSATVSARDYEDAVRHQAREVLREFGKIPVVAVSGLKGHGMPRLIQQVTKVHDAWSRRVETWVLNKV